MNRTKRWKTIAAVTLTAGTLMASVGTAGAAQVSREQTGPREVTAQQTYDCGNWWTQTETVTLGGWTGETWQRYQGYYSGRTVIPTRGLTSAGIEAQCLLASLYFNVGPIDGDFGPQSRQAARDFQSWMQWCCDSSIAADGLIGPKTWPWLRYHAALHLREPQ